jgi:hypothetical protein
MDTSKFKGLAKVLSVFKGYSPLLAAGVIGLVAVLFLVMTPLLMGSKLKKEITASSIRLGEEIDRLRKREVARNQWKEEEKYQQEYASDANKIELLAKQSTQRELLSYKIFPERRDRSTLIFEEFGQRFREGIEDLLAQVNARVCPTDAELERHLQNSLGSGLGGARRGPRGARFSYRGPAGVEAILVKEALCRERAESARVYANPADLAGYEFWADYTHTAAEEAVEECWYWQLGYWIIEDVIDTIDVVNVGSDSVFTSPVKRLMDVSFRQTGRRYSRFGRKGGSVDGPSYVLSVEEGLTRSCTARVCNNDIDVVHFRVSVVVGAEAVLPFMRELCSVKEHEFKGLFGEAQEPKTFKHNQITILESAIEPIDREGKGGRTYSSGYRRGRQSHDLCRYGEDAVVKLDLVCEYVFYKSGYDKIKPESIKELTAGSEPGPAPKKASVVPKARPQTKPQPSRKSESKPSGRRRLPDF